MLSCKITLVENMYIWYCVRKIIHHHHRVLVHKHIFVVDRSSILKKCLEKKLRDNFNFPFPLCNEVQTTTARSLKIKKKESGRVLVNLRLTSTPSRILRTVRSCIWGFLGGLPLSSQLIPVSVSMQLSSTMSFRHCFISSFTFMLTALNAYIPWLC